MKNDKLHKVKSTGFKTPEDYFESFEDKLFERLDDKTSIADIDATGFNVPEAYFDNFDEQLMGQLQAETPPVIQLHKRMPWYYMAGVAAALLLMFAIFVDKGDEGITAEMVESYFENSDLDSYDIAELLVDAEFLEEDFTLIEPEFSEEHLESYLLEHSDIEAMLQE